MWSLTKEHCKTIPISKSDEVIFTLTDYKKNPSRYSFLIEILKKNYSRVYFLIQGVNDEAYLNSIISDDDIVRIPPTLDEFTNFLNLHQCDYVGTRLHAGIKAMQCSRRSIIIAIDNRALELERDYHITCIHEDEMEEWELQKMIWENISIYLSEK